MLKLFRKFEKTHVNSIHTFPKKKLEKRTKNVTENEF